MARPSSPPRYSSRSRAFSNKTGTKTSHTSLSALALNTKRRIKWNTILRGGDATTSTWKWLENARNFSIYTKQSGLKGSAVLAIGVVKGSVPEVASLLTSFGQDEYTQKMAALYEMQFKNGTYLHDVEINQATVPENESVHLSVRTATFAKTRGWLRSNDEWCYLDATTMNNETHRFEQLLTTLKPDDVYNVGRNTLGNAKHLSDVIAGYRVEPDQQENGGLPHGAEDSRGMQHDAQGMKAPRVAARVHFYAEYSPPSSSSVITSRFGRLSVGSSRHSASSKAINQRLLHAAKSCDRLSHLIRRRRLGMQVLIDQKRIYSPPKSKCFNCDKRLRLVAKLCRVCGQGVCGDCSDVLERETHSYQLTSTRVRLESIRVCDSCLARVENANFSGINDAALTGQMVFPNPPGAKLPEADLKDLLQDALLEAQSPQRKSTVMSVIRCVLDQEKRLTPPTTPSPLSTITEDDDDLKHYSSGDGGSKRGILLTPLSGENEHVDALDYLEVKCVPFMDVEISAPEGRIYAMDSRSGDPAAQMTFPIPENEAQRVEAIKNSMMLDAGTLDELNIICDIAAKELNSFASLISLITDTEQRVIGANMPTLADMILAREDTFCQHTIMDTKPLVVPHPEADIRFSKITPVISLGAQYYCGFPLVADDGHNTVIGSLCCIDNKANQLTESQFAVLQKLAQTAAKVVRIQGEKRRRSGSARPSGVESM